MGLAAEMIYTDHEAKMQHVREVRDYLVSEVTKIEGVYDHSVRHRISRVSALKGCALPF